MCTGTNSRVTCPKCGVGRAELRTGQWCSTCGYNPKYESEIKKLEEILQSATLIEAEGVQLMIMPLWKDRRPGSAGVAKPKPKPPCGVCGDSGYVRFPGQRVKPCPKGCKPPREETEE